METLAEKAQEAEGLPKEVDGATVRPVYHPREMTCIAVTESELKQIGLSNVLMTMFFGIASGLLAFGVDIDKDLYMAEKTPEQVAVVADMISDICLGFSIVFYLCAVGMWFWRRDILKQIKRETKKG